MKYLQQLINQIRRETENEESSAFTGIQDSEFIQYINDAQHHLQALISAQHPRVFVEEATISVVKDQERYSLPDDILLENKVHNVEYSTDARDFYTLNQTNLKNRTDLGETGTPSNYIRLSGQLLLTPIPDSTGTLRINYIRRIKELGLRSGIVSADLTLNSSGTSDITLNNTRLVTDTDSLLDAEYICVVDRYGNIKLSNLPIYTINAKNDITASKITVDLTGYTAKNTDLSKNTLALSIDDYIIIGKNTTTHSELPKSIERYLISYCSWKILKRDSSVDSTEMQQELQMMAQEIVASYANISDDVQSIPIINDDNWSF